MPNPVKNLIKSAFLGFATLLGTIAAPASANSAIELESQVFVERIIDQGDSKAVRLEEPDQVLPGDQLIFILRYRNISDAPVTDFVITNPLPQAVAFRETLDGTEQVSVDGGNSWGRLQNLRIATADGGYRPATVDDVTHVRWSILREITKGSEGKLTFRGIVR
ncbi:MAG: hypothetical protein AAFX04_05610 [Pseudomonadota bacterium]